MGERETHRERDADGGGGSGTTELWESDTVDSLDFSTQTGEKQLFKIEISDDSFF